MKVSMLDYNNHMLHCKVDGLCRPGCAPLRMTASHPAYNVFHTTTTNMLNFISYLDLQEPRIILSGLLGDGTVVPGG